MDFLRLTAEGVEEAARSEIDFVAFALYPLFPDYEWLMDVEDKYDSYFEYSAPKREKDAFLQYSTVYGHQIQHFREYYYSLGTSAAGSLMTGKQATLCIDQIISCLSEQKTCELPELLLAKQTLENELRDMSSKVGAEYRQYIQDYIEITKHEERFYLLGMFVYALEKQLSLQKRFLRNYVENKELIEKLYAPFLTQSITITEWRKNYKGSIPK